MAQEFFFQGSVSRFSQKAIQLYYNNRVAELYCKSDKSSARLRHIDINFLSLKIEFGITLCLLIMLVPLLTLQSYSLKDSHLKCS